MFVDAIIVVKSRRCVCPAFEKYVYVLMFDGWLATSGQQGVATANKENPKMPSTPLIRRIRKQLEKDKINQKINLLWCLFSLVIIPVISGLYFICSRLLPEILISLVVVLLLLTITLSISLVFLRDRFKVAKKYLKNQKVTWAEVENNVEYSEAFGEATKNQDKV
jgi:hypothetical protein